jgi:hypothetical protein
MIANELTIRKRMSEIYIVYKIDILYRILNFNMARQLLGNQGNKFR